MANWNPKDMGTNQPYKPKPDHLSHLMNQPGKPVGVNQNQAMDICLPELMNQGPSTEHPADHMEGRKKGPSLGEMMGQ